MNTSFSIFQLGRVCTDLDPCPEGLCRDTCGGKGYECTYQPGMWISRRASRGGGGGYIPCPLCL